MDYPYVIARPFCIAATADSPWEYGTHHRVALIDGYLFEHAPAQCGFRPPRVAAPPEVLHEWRWMKVSREHALHDDDLCKECFNEVL